MGKPQNSLARQTPFQWNPGSTADGADVSDVPEMLRAYGRRGLIWLDLAIVEKRVKIGWGIIGFAVFYLTAHLLWWLVRDLAARWVW